MVFWLSEHHLGVVVGQACVIILRLGASLWFGLISLVLFHIDIKAVHLGLYLAESTQPLPVYQ